MSRVYPLTNCTHTFFIACSDNFNFINRRKKKTKRLCIHCTVECTNVHVQFTPNNRGVIRVYMRCVHCTMCIIQLAVHTKRNISFIKFTMTPSLRFISRKMNQTNVDHLSFPFVCMCRRMRARLYQKK